MKTKKLDSKAFEKQQTNKAAENRKVWTETSILFLQVVACASVGVLIGIGLAAVALSL